MRPQFLVHPVALLARLVAFHPEAVAPELPVAAPAFLAVAERGLPAGRPVPFPARLGRAGHFLEAAVAARAFAAVEQTQSARSC